MLVIAGASGFVGGHLVDRLLATGKEVSCLVRSEKAAPALLAKGCGVIRGDITQADTLRNILHPEDIVIHLVGIIEEQGPATFRSVHVQGTRNLVDEAKRAGIRHFFYQSALGSDKTSWSGYLKTKAEAEEIVMQSGIPFTVFRPSLIIGPWDGFTRKMVDLIRRSPVIPIPGDGKARFQPLAIQDWLKCLERVLGSPGDFVSSYDLGGPEHLTYRQIVEKIAAALGTNKPIVSMPMGIMKVSVGLLEGLRRKAPVSSDQLRLLEQDNICDLDAVKRHFGFMPERLDNMLREFVR